MLRGIAASARQTMSAQADMQALFGLDGPLAAALPDYRPRDGQITMATAVAQTLTDGGVLAVEAGTGVGKTYAYLAPLLQARLPTLVSTATKTLQDKLFTRDIPALQRMLGVPVRAALLKGRGSYLCRLRLETARQAPTLTDAMVPALASVERWSLGTRTGDLAEVQGLDDSSPVQSLVTSTRDNCLGGTCPRFDACHVYAARREAMAADLVVINHHLFFADLQVRESGVAELLPTVRAVVFDEAHQLNDIGVQFLGQHWSQGQIQVLAQDLTRQGHTLARGYADWEGHGRALEQTAQELRQALATPPGPSRMEGQALWALLNSPAVGALWGRLLDDLAQAQQSLAAVVEMAPELALLHERVAAAARQWALLQQAVPQDQVRWADRAGPFRVVQAPLDIAAVMRSQVAGGDGQRAWIFTSATLGHDRTLSWFTRHCGLEQAQVLQVPSPFDYARQASLYVPEGFPSAGDESHSDAVARLAGEGALALDGRTMVLTTTLRALRHIGEILARQAAAGTLPLRVLVQGQAPKRDLLDQFCHLSGEDGRGSILVATASFWEGVDIPGAALQLLVIDKLPFAPPDDPLLRARAQQLEAEGKSAFKELHLPMAAVALKQGAGRLIRRESDRGVLVICDGRLLRMGYGRKLLQAIPPMARLDSPDALALALRALAGR